MSLTPVITARIYLRRHPRQRAAQAWCVCVEEHPCTSSVRPDERAFARALQTSDGTPHAHTTPTCTKKPQSNALRLQLVAAEEHRGVRCQHEASPCDTRQVAELSEDPPHRPAAHVLHRLHLIAAGICATVHPPTHPTVRDRPHASVRTARTHARTICKASILFE